jgi:putative flippase GtrA
MEDRDNVGTDRPSKVDATRVLFFGPASSWHLIGRALRFVAVGSLCAILSFLAFRGGIATGMNYVTANAFSWSISLAAGFMLNRIWTFGHHLPAQWARQLALYLAGAISQLAISTLGLALLIGQLKLTPTPAWVINTGACALLSFLWLHVVFPDRDPHP